MPDWLNLACLNCTLKAACLTQGMQCMCVGHCFRNLLCSNWEMCVAQIEFEVEVCRRWGGGRSGRYVNPRHRGQPPVNSLRVNKQLCPVDMSTWMMADRLLREFPTRLLNITWAWCLRLSSKEMDFSWTHCLWKSLNDGLRRFQNKKKISSRLPLICPKRKYVLKLLWTNINFWPPPTWVGRHNGSSVLATHCYTSPPSHLFPPYPPNLCFFIFCFPA